MTSRAQALACLVAVTMAAITASDAAAAWLALTDKLQAEALRTGQKSITADVWGGEWRIEHAPGESVTVITPFHRLAIAARNAAFENRPVKPADQEEILSALKDRLLFSVHLTGRREDFARFYAPRLLVHDLEIEPAFVQNERTALKQEGGTYLARNTYAFPVKDIDPRGKAVLLIRDQDGHPVIRFAIDFAKMR
ncbi:MAG: hypothetical protein HYR86_05025 [Candidatus Rokubacteria bacterium]|nr:hypothetical protein [Candidatus Rokubacteria bacterium]